MKRILKAKKQVELDARSRWPVFVTLAEDRALMSNYWKEEYPDWRIIFWDNTNVNIPSPSDAQDNRETFSAYYGDNVAKGGVFLFLCGWMGTWELWGGAISDTDYVSKSGIFDAQTDFVEKHDKADADVKHTNVTLLQPFFAKADRKFSTREVLHSAKIASHRSGNERAVNVAKRSGKIARGAECHEDLGDIADLWLCWGFQANFMFRPIH